MITPKHPAGMTARERITEIARLLASSYLRLLQKESVKCSPETSCLPSQTEAPCATKRLTDKEPDSMKEAAA